MITPLAATPETFDDALLAAVRWLAPRFIRDARIYDVLYSPPMWRYLERHGLLGDPTIERAIEQRAAYLYKQRQLA